MAADAGDPGPSDEELPPDPFPGDPFADAEREGRRPDPGTGSGDPIRDLLAGLGALGGGFGDAGLGGMAGMSGMSGMSGMAGGLGALGPLLGALGGSSGGLAWDTARQLALWTAAGGAVEPTVDPMERIRLEELVRATAPVVADTTGLDLPVPQVEATTCAGWAALALEDLRPLLDRLARATGAPGSTTEPAAGDDPFGQLFRLIGPMLTSSTVGAVIGRLGASAMGTFVDVVVPRPKDRLTLVPSRITAFAHEWSVTAEQAATQVVLLDLVTLAVLRVPHVRARLGSLLERHADAARVDTDGLAERLEGIVGSGAMPSPDAFRIAQATPVQLETRREIAVLLTPIVGFVDYTAMVAGARLLGDNRKVVEAWKRRGVGDADLTSEVTELLGVPAPSTLAERGAAFVGGVLQRAGRDGLDALWERAEHQPTPAELDAPGLWLARIGRD